MKKAFTESELAFFERASFDRNPLHRDDSYARKTQFGEKVVYGIYGVLFGLGEWLAERNVRLSTIKGEFKKPLLAGVAYDLNFTENESRTEITFSRNGIIFLKSRMGPSRFEDHPFRWPNGHAFVPRLDAAAQGVQCDGTGILEIPSSRYSTGWDDHLEAPAEFRLRRGQLPFEQMTALVWSSYFVGMEVPGRQALYSSFEFEFDPEETTAGDFQVSPLRVEMDRRFNRLTIQGTATGTRLLNLSSFERPAAVQTSIHEVQKCIGTGSSLSGKNVLITGASRGFGAVMAQAFALQGARVLLNFFQSRKEAEELAASISEFGPAPILLQGDASQARDWETVKHDFGAIDVLINNASPVIPAAKFREQTTPDFLSFVDRSLELFLVPCAQLLPHMSAEGIVVQVSSVFVTQPGPGFSHYIAAKSAAEAVMRSLAQEHKSLRFLIFRAPRMLTDQTNSAVPPENLASPIEVAKTLLERLDKFEPHANLQLFSY